MLCGSLDGRGVWRKWIHLHVWICPFPVHLKPLQHCLLISYTPTQYKKFFKMFKKNTAKNESHYSGPLVSVGKWFQDPDRYQISPCSSPWHKTNKLKKKKKSIVQLAFCLQMWNLCVPTRWAEQLPVLTDKCILARSLF